MRKRRKRSKRIWLLQYISERIHFVFAYYANYLNLMTSNVFFTNSQLCSTLVGMVQQTAVYWVKLKFRERPSNPFNMKPTSAITPDLFFDMVFTALSIVKRQNRGLYWKIIFHSKIFVGHYVYN